ELSVREWKEWLKNVEEELKALQPPQEIVDMGAGREASIELEDRSDIQDIDIDMLGEEITRRYYTNAVRFVHQIHTAIPTLCQLLVSTTKSEVLEAIDFFVTAYTYKIEFAREGLKKMLYLIWTKDNNDEEKRIRKRLIESYRKLYFDFDISISDKKNLDVQCDPSRVNIFRTASEYNINEEDISDEFIAKLWSVYSVSKKEIPKA
ncbi:13057_t:CDS:2, partial [Acaulospora morrowiae]